MPPDQPSQELTFRDVLSQIDRRLSLLEEDLRSLRAYIDARFDAVMARFDTAQNRADTRFGVTEDRFQRLEDRWDRKFRWFIGLSFAGWLSMLSMMTAVLLK